MHSQNSKQELIETIISSVQSDQVLFSLSYLDKFLDDEVNKKEVHRKILQLLKSSGIICDNLRSANLANYENFKKLLSNDFSFSNEEVIKKLYNYGMFASR